jgi:2-keto-3-deoxy-L-rhamnonate aldolase RhmA
MIDAVGQIAGAAAQHRKVFGMHAGEPLLRRWIPGGMRFIMNDLDIGILHAGMQTIRERFKREQ